MSQAEMSLEELLALPVSVDLVTAGRAFGLGRTKAHELARSGQFPCRVIKVGSRYRVPRTALLEALGVGDDVLPGLTRGQAATFYEGDEDPQSIFDAFDGGEKGVTGHGQAEEASP